MITVIAAAIMELIDTSIANVIIIPITSFLSARLGRKNYYIGSVILFTFFSFLCGQASNIWFLVICRFFQGMGGGAFIAIMGLLLTARLLQRGVPPVVMITAGMLFYILFSWQISRLDLTAGSGDFYIPLIFRAIGIAIITVPLSTLAVSGLDQKDMPQGTALNNMMRQLGGSFGIAMVNTYLTRRNAVHRADLVTRIVPGDPQVALAEH